MLGPRIAALRRKAGMSQAELAHRLKLSPSAVGMYEQGRREPSVETLVDMASALGVTVDFLLTGQAEKPQEETLEELLSDRVESACLRMAQRGRTVLSRQELVVLLAAMLME